MATNILYSCTNIPTLSSFYLKNHCDCLHKTSLLRVFLGLLLLFSGIALMLIPMAASINNANTSVAIMTTGLVCAVAGLYLSVFSNSRMVYSPTGSGITHKALYFSEGDKEDVLNFLKSGGTTAMPRPQEQGSILVDCFYDEKYAMICMQMCEYRDFNYEPYTSPITLKGDSARQMCALLGR